MSSQYTSLQILVILHHVDQTRNAERLTLTLCVHVYRVTWECLRIADLNVL